MKYIVCFDYNTCTRSVVRQEGVIASDEPQGLIEVQSFQELYYELMARKPKDQILVVACYPMREAMLTFVTPDLESYQRAVGGNIQFVSVAPYADIICNEEGKLNQLMLNRGLYRNGTLVDVIAGPMYFVGVDNEGRTISLTCAEMEKIYYRYLEPEVFVRDHEKGMRGIKCSSAIAEILRENNISIIGY